MRRTVGLLGLALLSAMAMAPVSAQVVAPKVENVPIPPGVDRFSLSLDDFKKYSSSKNFELLGQSLFQGSGTHAVGERAGPRRRRGRLRLQHRARL